MCQVQCYVFSHMFAEFTLVRILFKRYDSYFTNKETEMNRPKVNMPSHWDSGPALQTPHMFGPPASMELHHRSSPLYKVSVKRGGVGIFFFKMKKTFIRLSHLLIIYILDLCPTHIACSGYNLNSGGQLKHVCSLISQFQFKRKWPKLSKPFLSCLTFVSKGMLANEICLGWIFCYHGYNF